MFETFWRSKVVDRPRVVAICDVSGSVRQYARFLLLFLHSLGEQVSDLRSFAFTNHLVEVSDTFESLPVEQAVDKVMQAVGGSGTDYGQTLLDIEAQLLDDIDRRTTVLILGDARNNRGQAHAEVMQLLYQRARRVIWLNPEPVSFWGLGDSEMKRYAPYCHIARECTPRAPGKARSTPCCAPIRPAPEPQPWLPSRSTDTPMARPSLQLHPRKEPVTAHPAATLLLLRDGALGVEVLMTRRSPTASFLPGAYVFPGGRVDPADHHAHTLARAPDAAGRYRTAALAALRETFEELGILLAEQADGRPITRTHLQALDRSRAPYPQRQAQGWSLAVDQARMLACWTTDRSVPKRFDTAFFAALMPDQQEPVADEMEQFEPVWVRPEDALTQHQAGNFFMIFPTIRTLHWLADFEQAEQALAACTEDAPRWNSCPRGGLVGGQPQRFMEHEAPYGAEFCCWRTRVEHAG